MLNQDFKDMLSLFLEEKVDFLVVGSYALAAHGCPRATGDIDLWVRCSKANSVKVWKALARFGAPLKGVESSEFEAPGILFQIGVPPRRIDILTVMTGIIFERAWEARKTVELEGMSLPVIGKDHFVANKKAAGRPKDLADVALLEEYEGGRAVDCEQ